MRHLLLISIAAVHLHAAGTGQQAALPAGAKLDPQRVLAERYAAQSPISVPVRPAAAAPAGGITNVTFETGTTQAQVPVTFGQVFAPGALRPGEQLAGKLADGGTVPLQVDAKARHADGSVRHAVISAVLPRVAANAPLAMALVRSQAPAGARMPAPAQLLDQGFTASVSAVIDGERYTASADKLLVAQKPATWLSGPVASEWEVAAPLSSANGQVHPHLSARFAIRWYPAAHAARVDVTVENDWAYEPSPRNFVYDAVVSVGGKEVYAKNGLTHYHHARWRKLFWWGAAPAVHVRHDTNYLIATRALPNYDRTVSIPDLALAALQSQWTGPRTEPMGVGAAAQAMPTTGGRPDIGLLPAWGTMYLLTMDQRAGQVTLGTADLAGSWSIHYRDKRTGRPVSLLDYPYMTIVGKPGDTLNPATRRQEAFPPCAAPDACKSPYVHDVAHQPAFAYLPYLVTGDRYYLEELQFWAMYDVFSSNPGYRDNAKGLLKPEQVRGQAWGLRTLGEAAYITPDDDPLKRHFVQILNANLDWYNATYANNPSANKLGVIANGYALVYDKQTALAPWQDDFFTAAVGHVWELGFDKAAPLLKWKARFPIGRMIGPGVCWVDGTIYAMKVRDSASSAIYNTIGEAYRASHKSDFLALPCGGPEMAAALKLGIGEMAGYSSVATGFPSNMQPALAYAADAGGEAGRKAWAQFMARSVKPDYGTAPQFAIVPR
ncbi:hypothetical protein NX773_08475 [Massilia solisilvae]|uniref:PcRGLX/YetA-like N-terminal RIFT barrel domain-containing protein n=1 Tax=Massilia solisilvae TaxID=1811225 RepID=A0ABT2BIA8_9BURK|nr:hypothetical protein [Massilia solisilvae]MCS0608197.1 hypothetical protein [Massilia solisilvae]